MEQEVIITKNVIKTGDSYAIIIPQDVAKALEIVPGNLIQIKIHKIDIESLKKSNT